VERGGSSDFGFIRPSFESKALGSTTRSPICHEIRLEVAQEDSRLQGGDFCVQDGMPRVLQGRLNIGLRQFRVAAQQGIPRFITSQLLQYDGHRNTRALDDRLAAANSRIDFNALVHV
jgi:hypothetical protein